MSDNQHAELKGNGRQQPVFEGVQVQAELLDSLSVTTVTQSYRNNEAKTIEVIYTFPLPLDAVLLEMTVTLGDTTLQGTVLAKQEAEEQYEDAITDGDAPVMLQNPQPGIFSMNVGNLLPGEKAVISFRYGMFHSWQGDTLRYHLPTTIAPRYGSWEQAGLEQHQEPETSILVDNLCSFTMTIRGKAAGMMIESPSHSITVDRKSDSDESSITLDQKTAFMDRDLIITVQKDMHQAATAMIADDNGQHLLWASVQPRFDLPEDLSPRSIKIVVDCSGSMEGDSIAQARQALFRIIDALRPQDWFNIVAFGSTATPLFNAQVKANKESLAYARGFLKKLDADMGGTEIGPALELAARLRCPDKVPQDILLITDGEISEWEHLVAKAKNSKHRFFTVGVGSSVSEAFVKTLAEQTGGACELVSPNENMAERIHRHFKRISTPGTKSVDIQWPIQPLRVYPDPLTTIYNGDTCNLFAWFDKVPAGTLSLRMTLPDGTANTLETCIDGTHATSADLPRMAAALRLRETGNKQAGQELAVKYQLVSKWTNYLAIIQRDEESKTDTLPELRRVQQMLAAGWGGTGTTMYSAPLYRAASAICCKVHRPSGAMDIPTFLRDRGTPAFQRHASTTVSSYDAVMEPCSANPLSLPPPVWIWDDEDQEQLERFMELMDLALCSGIIPTTLQLPLLPPSIAAALSELRANGLEEQVIVTLFLYHLSESDAGEHLSRQSKRMIIKAYKSLNASEDIQGKVNSRLQAAGGMR